MHRIKQQDEPTRILTDLAEPTNSRSNFYCAYPNHLDISICDHYNLPNRVYLSLLYILYTSMKACIPCSKKVRGLEQTVGLLVLSILSITGIYSPPIYASPVSELACGRKLLVEAGKVEPELSHLLNLYKGNSRSQEKSFLIHMFAVISVESQFHELAHSSADGYGLMQITKVAVADGIISCNLPKMDSYAELYDPATNIKYGTCYLKQLLDKNKGDWDRTLIEYNGGNRQLRYYDEGKRVTAETAQYVLSVRRAVAGCTR